MKIRVRDIPEQGLALHQELPAQDIGLGDDLEGRPLSSLRIDAFVEKVGDEVSATVDVQGQFGFTCARCLESFVRDSREQLEVYFDIDPSTEILDLGEEIRQEMVMALTRVSLCREDCRGLCAGCGANLNTERCRCKKKT